MGQSQSRTVGEQPDIGNPRTDDVIYERVIYYLHAGVGFQPRCCGSKHDQPTDTDRLRGIHTEEHGMLMYACTSLMPLYYYTDGENCSESSQG